MDLRRALATAVSASAEAGDILRRDFHRPGGPRGERDKAEADVEAEVVIRRRLMEAFPEWGYLGEETGAISAPGQPVWLVDPNDGTRDYLRGWRGSAVSIGLAVDGRPVLGVVEAFNYPDDRGTTFAWAEGCGPVLVNGQAVESHLPAALGPGHVVVLSSQADMAAEAYLRCVEPARLRVLPSIAHRLARLASGEVDAVVSIHGPGAWDYGAGHALVRAVGGVLVDERGREVTYDAEGRGQTQRVFAGAAEVVARLAPQPWAEVKRAIRGWKDERPVQLERGRAVADPGLLSRAQGCLLGQLAGDSLGSLVEFEQASAIAARHGGGPAELADGGTFDTLAGQPTDDSEMALELARSLVAAGRYDERAVLARYVAWLRSGPFDVGNTTRAALQGAPPPDSQANGSLMRCSPLAIFGHALAPAEVAALGRSDSTLTHPHAVCGDAVGAWLVAASHAVRTGEGPEAAYTAALAWAKDAAQPAVVETLEAGAHEAPSCDRSQIGWVLIALRNAFYELLHARTLEEGVVRTVRRGGDTDTNAAIAGALLGAVHGRDAVPPQWQKQLLSCRPIAPWARHPRPIRYWPTDVLELAERLLLAGA